MIRDFPKFLIALIVGISGVMYWINHEWTLTKEFLINNQILSFSEEGVSVVFVVNIKWYLIVLTAIIIVGFFYMTYQFFKKGQEFDLRLTAAMAWFSFDLMIVSFFINPVPFYGLIIGLVAFIFVNWLFFNMFFPKQPKQINN